MRFASGAGKALAVFAAFFALGFAGSASAATYVDLTKGWHPLGQIANTSDSPYTSVDINSNWVIDKADNSFACSLDSMCKITNQIDLLGTGGWALVQSTTPGMRLELKTQGTGNIYLNPGSSGNVGIGTTSPGSKLDVQGGNISSSNFVKGVSGLCIGNDCRTSWAGVGFPAGTSGQTLRHDGTNWVANSIIYNNGVNVGIGTSSPGSKLDVSGSARISGSLTLTGLANCNTIDTDASGALKCGTDEGIAGTGLANYMAKWTGASALGNSGVYETPSGDVGIGTVSPGSKLDVQGGNISSSLYAIGQTGLCIGNDCRTGWPVDTRCDLAGTCTQLCIGTDCKTEWPVLPSGTSGQTLRHNGTDWVANSVIYNNGNFVGIGTTSPAYKMDVSGDVRATRFCLGGWCISNWREINLKRYAGITSQGYNGNLGGTSGANNKCSANYYGSHMCNLNEANQYAIAMPLGIYGWFNGGDHDCSDWTTSSGSSLGSDGARRSDNTFDSTQESSCVGLMPIHCCLD